MCGGSTSDTADDNSGSGNLSRTYFASGRTDRLHTVVVEEAHTGAASGGAPVYVNFDVQGCQGGYQTDCNGVCQPSGWIRDGVCDNGNRRVSGPDVTADFYCDTTFSGEVCDCTGNARGVCGSYEQCEEDQVFGWVTILATTVDAVSAPDGPAGPTGSGVRNGSLAHVFPSRRVGRFRRAVCRFARVVGARRRRAVLRLQAGARAMIKHDSPAFSLALKRTTTRCARGTGLCRQSSQ